MKQPSLLENGEKAVDRFTNFIMWLCFWLLCALFVLIIFCCWQHGKINDLEGKAKTDAEAIQSYKNFYTTPIK